MYSGESARFSAEDQRQRFFIAADRRRGSMARRNGAAVGKQNAEHTGCIGSRKKVALTREKLSAAGFSTQEIDRIHAPIGLPILAETPEEIAVSIAAEMIRHRAEQL